MKKIIFNNKDFLLTLVLILFFTLTFSQLANSRTSAENTNGLINLNLSENELFVASDKSNGKWYCNTNTKTIFIYSGPITITGTTTIWNINVADNTTVDITLDNATIDKSITNATPAFYLSQYSNVNLTIKGSNTLAGGAQEMFSAAALEVTEQSTITIEGSSDSILYAKGGPAGAGIGGGFRSNSGLITINSGNIVATAPPSQGDPAGIGRGGFSIGTVIINGGNIIAIGSKQGIGSGSGVVNGSTTINGGTVTTDITIGIGNANGYSKVIINGGSVKTAKINAPQNNLGNRVYPAIINTQGEVNGVTANDNALNISSNHPNDDNAYIYLPSNPTTHTVDIQNTNGQVTRYTATWNPLSSSFLISEGSGQTNTENTGIALNLDKINLDYKSTTPINIEATITESSISVRAIGINTVDFYLDDETTPFAKANVSNGIATTSLLPTEIETGEHKIIAKYGESYGGNPSKTKKTFHIEKILGSKDPAYNKPVNLNCTYSPSGTLDDMVLLPSNWQWKTSTETPTVGKTIYTAIYTPQNKNHTEYEEELSVSVAKAETEPITYPNAANIKYGQTLEKAIFSNESGNGSFSWEDGNIYPELGISEHTVVFTPDDSFNYNYSDKILKQKVSIITNNVVNSNNNKIILPSDKIIAGKAFELKAEVEQSLGLTPVIGDQRYLPTDWNVNPSGVFTDNNGIYTASVTIPTAGEYLLSVNFNLQEWNGNDWVETDVVDEKSVSLTVEKSTSQSVDTAVKLQKDLPKTGNQYLSLIGIIFTILPILFFTRFYLVKKKSNR